MLGAIRYQPNRAVLHTDTLVPPSADGLGRMELRARRRPAARTVGVCLHYLINRLQPLPWQQPVIVSLNPVRDAAAKVHQRIEYSHPVFDLGAIAAQRRLPPSGRQRRWFCGAWMRLRLP